MEKKRFGECAIFCIFGLSPIIAASIAFIFELSLIVAIVFVGIPIGFVCGIINAIIHRNFILVN